MLLWAGILWPGCTGSDPTSILLQIQAEPGAGPFDELRLWIFDPRGTVVQNQRLPEQGTPELPDEVVIYPKLNSGKLRILVRGIKGGAISGEGVTTVLLRGGEQVGAEVVISPKLLPDADADGVPDAVDNCPGRANPNQGPCGGDDGGPDKDAWSPPDGLNDGPSVSKCTHNEDCEDNDLCTDDTCHDGACSHEPAVCPTAPCKTVGCDPLTGCYFVDKDDGETCDDHDPCTQGEACAAGQCAAPDPVIEVIEIVDVGLNTSTVVDSKGVVHTLYHDQGKRSLRYATKGNSGGWQVKVIHQPPDASTDAGRFPAVAVDGQDDLHALYSIQGTGGGMVYAFKAAGSTTWTKSSVGPGLGHSAIAVGGSGSLHISFSSQAALWYGVRAPGASAWKLTKVDEPPATATISAGVLSSIAVDQGGKAHVAHSWGEAAVPFKSTKVRYSTDYSGTWTSEDVVPGMTAMHGDDPSIAVAPDGTLYISHYPWVPGGLQLSVKKPGSPWKTTQIQSGKLGSFSSILLNSKQQVHIAYREYGAGELRHITDATGQWVHQVLDTAGNTGRYASMYRGPSGRLHITYLNDTSNEMKHAVLSACP